MRWIWLPAGLLYAALALYLAWNQGELLPQDVALHYLRGLDCMDAIRAGQVGAFVRVFFQTLPNPGFVGGWIGLWMAILGPSKLVAVGSLLPWHLGLAWGLWKGGRVVGGELGGGLALALGLAQPLGIQQAMSIHPDLLLFAGAAWFGSCLLAGESGGGGLAVTLASKVAALPSLLPLVVDGLWQARRDSRRLLALVVPGVVVLALWYAPVLGQIQSYAGGSDRIAEAYRGIGATGLRLSMGIQNLAKLAGPGVFLATIAALLLRRDGVTVRLIGWSIGSLVVLSFLEHQPQERYVLPAMVCLYWAAASVLTVKRGKIVAGVAGVLQVGWMASPQLYQVLLQPMPEYELDGVLDRLEQLARQKGLDRARVAVQVDPGGALSGPAWVIRSREQGRSLEFFIVEDNQPLTEETDLGLVVDLPSVKTRPQWEALLPLPTEQIAWQGGYQVLLWDRGLPKESQEQP